MDLTNGTSAAGADVVAGSVQAEPAVPAEAASVPEGTDGAYGFDEAAILEGLEASKESDLASVAESAMDSIVDKVADMSDEEKAGAAAGVVVAAGVAAAVGAKVLDGDKAGKIADAVGVDTGTVTAAAEKVQETVADTASDVKDAVSSGASGLTDSLSGVSDASIDAAVAAGEAKLEDGDFMGGILAAVSEQISDLSAMHAHEPLVAGAKSVGKTALKAGGAALGGMAGIAGAKSLVESVRNGSRTQSHADRVRMAESLQSSVCGGSQKSASLGLGLG